jgi:hypothetical protein
MIFNDDDDQKWLMIFTASLLVTASLLSPTKKRTLFSRLPPKRADDYCKYDSKRAIFDVDYQVWKKKSFFEAFSKVEILMFFGERALNINRRLA